MRVLHQPNLTTYSPVFRITSNRVGRIQSNVWSQVAYRSRVRMRKSDTLTHCVLHLDTYETSIRARFNSNLIWCNLTKIHSETKIDESKKWNTAYGLELKSKPWIGRTPKLCPVPLFRTSINLHFVIYFRVMSSSLLWFPATAYIQSASHHKIWKWASYSVKEYLRGPL